MAALGGAAVVLIVQKIFFWNRAPGAKTTNNPISTTTVSSSQTNEKGNLQEADHVRGDPDPRLSAPRLRLNACRDLYSYVCAASHRKDPTGTVRTDAEGEVTALRIYENIIRSKPDITISDADDILVNKIYTPARVKRVRQIFSEARAGLLEFISTQPFYSLSEGRKASLRRRIDSVELQLPPPASVYADEPDLFTRNDVFYERIQDGSVRVRIGGALFFTVQSRYNLAFTLAHELAHSIDPCELHADGEDAGFYEPVVKCLMGGEFDLKKACSAEGTLAESFADWAATHIVSSILWSQKKYYSTVQMRSAVYNSVRDLCRQGPKVLSGPEVGLAATHPTNEFRVNDIFARHPAIRMILGCEDYDALEKTRDDAVNSCFWLFGAALLPQPRAAPAVQEIKK